jgi:hypothetical protein
MYVEKKYQLKNNIYTFNINPFVYKMSIIKDAKYKIKIQKYKNNNLIKTYYFW